MHDHEGLQLDERTSKGDKLGLRAALERRSSLNCPVVVWERRSSLNSPEVAYQQAPPPWQEDEGGREHYKTDDTAALTTTTSELPADGDARHTRSRRKRRLIWIGIAVANVVVLAAVLGGVLGTVMPQKHE
jgi:hypothetical protein